MNIKIAITCLLVALLGAVPMYGWADESSGGCGAGAGDSDCDGFPNTSSDPLNSDLDDNDSSVGSANSCTSRYC